MTAWIAALGSALALALGVWRWFVAWGERKRGRLEQRLEQAEKEQKRERRRADVDADTRRLKPNDLERELRNRDG